jgi:Ca2+-binding EF-hand superfamily protein
MSSGAGKDDILDEKKIKEMFDLFDADGGGSIDVAELTQALVTLGISDTRDEIDRLVQQIDVDGSGEIEYEEFVEVMEKLQEQRDSEGEMHKAFLYFSNGHDRITLSDLRKISIDTQDEQTEQMLLEMLTVADRDGDGVVTFQDFRNMMVQCIDYEQQGMDNPRKIIADANIRDGVRL